MLPTPFSIPLFVKYYYGQSFWNHFFIFLINEVQLGEHFGFTTKKKKKKKEEKTHKKQKKQQTKLRLPGN